MQPKGIVNQNKYATREHVLYDTSNVSVSFMRTLTIVGKYFNTMSDIKFVFATIMELLFVVLVISEASIAVASL